MKATRILLIAVWVLALQFTTSVLAQTFALKTYKITVNGTSSLHEWESDVEKVQAKGSFAVTDNTLTDVKDVVVNIPVTSIKSTKGRMMDKKTHEAFNHEKNPAIIFTLTGRKINEANGTLDVTGNLSMAGVTKQIEIVLKYKLLPGGELQVTGSKKLNMTEFKMEPPTAMMGAIQVGDEVTVKVDLVLAQSNYVKTSR